MVPNIPQVDFWFWTVPDASISLTTREFFVYLIIPCYVFLHDRSRSRELFVLFEFNNIGINMYLTFIDLMNPGELSCEKEHGFSFLRFKTLWAGPSAEYLDRTDVFRRNELTPMVYNGHRLKCRQPVLVGEHSRIECFREVVNIEIEQDQM